VSYSPAPFGLAAGRWRWYERSLLVVAGGCLLALLAMAAWLSPSPEGMGTHQQLGLPPCTFVAWLGIRCPSCGMTTSWSHMLRGNVLGAMRANAGGALLAITAAACGPWLLGSGLLGRWLGSPPREWLTIAVGLTIVIVTLVQWTLRISLGW
jgi:hypothetical protein